MDKLKIAVVGAGNRGPQHLRTIVGITDRFELVGICDMDDEKREAAAKFEAPGFAQLEDMVDKAKPDVVALIVGNRALPDLVPIVAQAGVHIATETPIARTLPVADFVIAAAKDAGVKLENFEQCWRWPREQLKRKILAAGVLGDMIQARCFTYVAPYHANAVFQQMVDSKATQVVGYGKETPICPAPENTDRTTRSWVVAAVEFENGVSGVFEMKARQPYITGHDFTNVDADCSQGHIIHDEIHITRDGATPKEGGVHEGSRNLVHYPIQEGWEEINGERILTSVWIDTDPVISWENPYKQYAPEPVYAGGDDYGRLEEYIHYHRVIVNDEQPEYGVERARHNIELMIAAQHSAKNGSEVLSLPLDPKIETAFQ